MIRGYIFDYGGTLDTHGCHWGKVIWHAYQRCGVPVTEAQFREAVYKRFKEIGFMYVTLDMGGYRRGSMNETLSQK